MIDSSHSINVSLTNLAGSLVVLTMFSKVEGKVYRRIVWGIFGGFWGNAVYQAQQEFCEVLAFNKINQL